MGERAYSMHRLIAVPKFETQEKRERKKEGGDQNFSQGSFYYGAVNVLCKSYHMTTYDCWAYENKLQDITVGLYKMTKSKGLPC